MIKDKEYIEYIEEIWEQALEILKEELCQVSFNTWIKSLKPIELSDDNLKILVTNEFAKSIVESRYSKRLKTIINQLTDKNINIEYRINYEYIDDLETLSIDDILKPVEDAKRIVEEVKSQEINIENKVKKQLKKIAESINIAAKNGHTSTCVMLYNEINKKEEIYNEVLKAVLLKGYDAELSKYSEDTIKLYW